MMALGGAMKKLDRYLTLEVQRRLQDMQDMQDGKKHIPVRHSSFNGNKIHKR